MAASETEDRDWQRLDTWLWSARAAKTRSACAALVLAGAVRLNRQPVAKPHAKLRVGDVLTLASGGAEGGAVRVWRVLSLAARRGSAAEARGLYDALP